MTTVSTVDMPLVATVPLDERSIDDMPFEGGDATRALLHRAGCKVAHDIELLGCTGAAAAGLSIAEITELRLGLAGGGVGLPCFVDLDRFCLAHNTIGGLQDGQKALHTEQIAAVSRDLTAEERGKVELIEAARRKRGNKLDDRLAETMDILSGRQMPPGFETAGAADESLEPPPVLPPPDYARDERSAAVLRARIEAEFDKRRFVCPEHTKTNWACRYCVAQAVVEVGFGTTFAVAAGATVDYDLSASAMEERIRALNDIEKEQSTSVYVLAARFTRRLARVE